MNFISDLQRRAGIVMEAREIFYHGSNQKIEQFTTEFVGNGTDQEGPGIYLTSDPNDAKRYGNFIHTVHVFYNKKRLIPERKKISYEGLARFIKRSPDAAEELQNWDENPHRALHMAVSQLLESYEDDFRELMEQVWYDFYRNHSALYLRRMVMFGYDGFKLQRQDNIVHFIVYNPNILKITNVLQS